MRLDQIVIEILEWLRKLLRKEAAQTQYAPIVIQKFSSPRGLLCQVERDTQSVIATWIFMPHRGDTPRRLQRDIHICLDTLGKERDRLNTHRVTILSASHWLKKDGDFDAEELHSGFYNLSGEGNHPDYWGKLVIKNLAKLLINRDIEEWDFEMRCSIAVVIKGRPISH